MRGFKKSSVVIGLLVVAVAASGCATKKYVRAEVGAVDARSAERVTSVESQVEELQTRADGQEHQMGEISETAREALERAIAAGKLAEGRFLYEAVFTDHRIGFGFDQAKLNEPARAALGSFAADLVERNQDAFIEIQGHTDAIGSEGYNLTLGEQRAEVVRRFLNSEYGLPLHRMSVISYGESAPIAENGSREDRALNRRVALVVLQ